MDIPFNILDVAYLLNLKLNGSGNSRYSNCPFCGETRRRMNVNLVKEVYRCNHCGTYGGVLDLYANVFGISRKDAFHEISEKLGNGEEAEYTIHKQEVEHKEPKICNAEPASDEEKNKTYRELLSLLSLSKVHKNNLLERGFSKEQITHNGYKSIPAFGFKRLANELLTMGCVLEGVPGFYKEKDSWSINFNPKSPGFLIPVRNYNGMIVGMQIRLDKVYKKRKYIWLSSINYNMGVTSGSPIHFVGDQNSKVVYVTEGPLKGDLAHGLSGKTFACVPGVNQYTNLKSFFNLIKANGVNQVIEVYDMDKLTNLNVEKGVQEFFKIALVCGLEAKQLTWDEKYKGIDDFLVSLEKKKLAN